jgi:IS30 family transposase
MQPLHTPPAAGTAKAGCLRLRQPPRDKLKLCWPPEQIAGWLAVSYPDDPKMRVRHETVYLSLFVRSGGASQGADPLPAQRPGRHRPRTAGNERPGHSARVILTRQPLRVAVALT